MTEALGVAGGVVSIVSLGIQVAQGLLKYYASWKDQDQDISDMCVSLESLRATLMIISKTAPAKWDTSAEKNVENNVRLIEPAVNKLKDELAKFEAERTGARALMRRHIRRATYPFKEETLRKIQLVISDARSNLTVALHTLQLDVTSDIYRNVNMLVRLQEDNETRKTLDWLSVENFRQKQQDVSSQRQPNTGQWLLDDPKFRPWAEGNVDTPLWCLGSPGVGKTVLSSAIVNFLEEDLATQKIGIAFAYCDHKRSESQQLEYFIAAFVRQLVERKPTIPKCVQTLYEKNQRGKQSPILGEYLELLQSLSNEYSEVYIIIDALDECISTSRKMIWNDLLAKLKKFVNNLRLLCTSRHIDHIESTSPGSSFIEIKATEEDLKAYIHAQVESQIELSIFCRQDIKLENDILQAVVSKADGMFLAALLHIKSLALETNLRALKRALNAIPATIDEIYDQTMTRIKQHPHKLLAMRALSWIAYTTRRLSVEEVQHAIAIDNLEPDDQSITKDLLPPQALIVNACAGLIKVDERSNVIGLVHKTAQEYFDRKAETHFPTAQLDIGTRCLQYLLLDVFSEGCCLTDELYERRLSENTLLRYAAENLGNHVHKENRSTLRDLVLKFLMDGRKLSCATQALFVGRRRWKWDGHSQHYPREFLGIHYAAYLGWLEILKFLIEKQGVDSRCSYGLTPLSWASRNGQEAVVKLLLESKADVELKDTHGWTPLLWAAEGGHEAVVKLLLKAKADIESNDILGQTPLLWAAERGHEAVVKLLLEAKADVESKDTHGQTPLLLAAEGGQEAVVKLLLESKADVESKDTEFCRTPLWWASHNGHEAVVKLLLEAKADVESKDTHGQTPLLLAAEGGQEAVVKLLLESKADVESKDTEFCRTPLWWASHNGHEAVVKLLLEAKADVESKDYRDRTPLLLAARGGNQAVVKLLQSTTTTTTSLQP